MDMMTFWEVLIGFLICCPFYELTSAAAIKTTENKNCSSEKGLTITHVYSVPGDGSEQLQTLESDDQNLVFRHHIRLQTPASDCEKNGLLADLLSRLQALEAEMKGLKEQCAGCCGAAGLCDNCNGHGRYMSELGRCQCDDGWEGPDCSTKSCPNNCAGNGICIDGICQCAEGYTGSDCSEKKCLFDCGRYGTCIDGSCKCAEGYTGPACRKKKCPFDCGEYGTCVDGICQCKEGYTGPACRKKKCPVDCGEHGKCIDGSCQCSEGYTGVDCKEKKCAVDCGPNGRCVDGMCLCNDGFIGSSCSIEIASLCSGHGKYLLDLGRCQCDEGWEGDDCSHRSCPNNCGNNGICVDGICQCSSGYTSLDCSQKECPYDCGVHGTCVDGSCQCSVGYTGLTCREEDCLISCGENGRCDGGQCFCEEGFIGESCSEVESVQNLRLISTTEDSLNIGWDLLVEIDYYLITYYPLNMENLKKQIQVSGNQDMYQILGLDDGTLYKILMYQVKNGVTSQPAELQARTDSTSLGTLWVTEETEDTLEVEWENPAEKVDYFKLKYAPQPKGPETEVMVSQSRDPKSSYIITGLQPSTMYEISVQSVRGDREGKSSAVIGMTGVDGPKNLLVTEVGENTARLSWEAAIAEIDKYMLKYSSRDGASQEVSVDKDEISAFLDGLIPGMEYTFQLWAEKGNKRSKRASVTVMTDIDAPKNLQSIDVTQTGASLTWTPPIAQIDGYILTYEDSEGNSQEIKLDSASKSFELNGLRKGLKYTVYLVAFKGDRRSRQASTIFYTDIDPPINLQSSDVTVNEASLTWTPPTAQIDGYILTYEDPDGNSQEVQLGSTSKTSELKGLRKGLEYKVYLVAFKGDRRSTQASTIFNTVAMIITHPSDCSQVQLSGNRKSGVYTIYPLGENSKGVSVYCDQDTDGGGWTVFQRRNNGKVDFYQRWRTYVEGFGDPSEEFWLGLEWLHKLTTSPTQYELRVDLRAGDESVYAVYNTFKVGSSRDRYRLTISTYSGTAGDALTYHNGWKFTTWDKDNDIALTNCALSHRGAFWYKNCHLANLNGRYGETSHSQGVNWEPWKGHEFSIPFVEMKIRPHVTPESNV
ncbi:tenascin-N-like [Rhinophrynus dorsalis]